jgi:hypothetical protein
MTRSIYDASIPVLARTLGNLKSVLAKGAEHAEKEKFEPSILLNARLYPDMLALGAQVQIACDMSKGCVARLAGVEPPKYEDNESTFAQFEARVGKTLDFVQSFKPAQLEGAGERSIVVQMRRGPITFASGWDYLSVFVVPNVYFHAATAYDILRHNGVRLGKADFLGAVG